MNLEKLSKQTDLLNKHVDFLINLNPENEEDSQHLESVQELLSEIIEFLSSDITDNSSKDEELNKLTEELKIKNQEIDNLKKELESTSSKDSSKKSKKKLKKQIREEVKTEFESRIGDLQTQIEELQSEVKKYKNLLEKSEQVDEQVETEEEIEESEPIEKPEDLLDIAGWEAYLDENPEDEEAKQAIFEIEKKARDENNFELLADALTIKINFDFYENEKEAIALIEELSNIYELELGNFEDAFNAMLIALDVTPEETNVLSALKRLANEGELWHNFVQELSDIAENIDNSKTTAYFLVEVARVYNERLHNTEKAIESLKRALKNYPNCSEALDELASIFKQQDRWEELIDVLKQRITISEQNEEKAFYLCEIASIQEKQLRDVFIAAATYEEVFSIIPDNMEAISALENIYRNHELYEQLASVLKRKAEYSESADESRQTRKELGFLYAKHLNEPQKAIDIFEHLIEVISDDAEMIRTMLSLYERLGRMRSYLKIAPMLIEITDDKTEKINLYKRMAAEWMLSPSTRFKAAQSYENIIKLTTEEESIYDSLEEIYETEEQWEDLARILEKHIEYVESDGVRAKLLCKLGDIRMHKLNNSLDAAVEALEDSRKIRPKNVEILKLLAKAYNLSERYPDESEILEILIEQLSETDEDKIHYVEQLGIALMEMGELEKAEEYLHKSLSTNEKSFLSLKGLGDIYYQFGQWTRAVNYYEKAIKVSKNELDISDVVFKAASIWSDKLDDKEKSVDLYKKLLEIVPGHPKATRILVDYYVNKQNWEQAAPLLNIVVSEADNLEKSEQVILFLKAGKISLNIGDTEKAAYYLEKARELEPTSLDVLLELAELRYEKEEWDGAVSLYQAILVAHRDALDKEKVADIYYKIGKIKENKGDKLKAASFYEKALESNPAFNEAADAVLRLKEANADYDKIIEIKLNRIEQEQDLNKKIELISDMIRFYTDTLKSPEQAVDLQEKAIELDPTNRDVLSNALDLFHLVEQWDKVINVILKLADMEEPGFMKSKYHYSVGLIFEEEIGDEESAVEQYNICLDNDSDNEEAWDRIRKIYTEREDWLELARSIRQQMKRNPDNRFSIELWDELAAIYYDKLGDYGTAISAYEAALQLENTPKRNETLANLCIEAGPDYFTKAEDALSEVLYHNPEDVASIKKLLEIAIVKQEKDKVWTLCNILTMYKQASKKEQLFYEKHATKEFKKATTILTDGLWFKLQSPDEDLSINKILSGMGHSLSLYYARPHSEFGLKRKQSIDIDNDTREFVKAFEYVSKLLLIQLRPELYEKEGLPIMIQLANTKDGNSLIPSWLIEKKLLNRMNIHEAAYHFARELVFLRPERLFRREAPAPKDLYNAIYAAFRVLAPKNELKIPKDREDEILKLQKHIEQTVAAATLDSLKHTAEVVVSRNFEEEIAKWIVANHRTSIRAATLVTNDLKHVVAWVLSEPNNMTGLPAKERVKEVMRFALSKDYFDLREQLGFAIK